MGMTKKVYTTPQRRLSDCIRYQSREKKGNHMILVANFPDRKSAMDFKKEMQKAIHKENRLLEDGFSFEMYLRI